MSGKFVIWRLALVLLALLASARSHGDNAYLSPPRIFDGDVAELVLEYDNKIPSLYALDTAELERDFRLLETDSKIMRVDDDGEIYHRMQWRLRLQPRASGTLRVPSISIGERQSRALQLEVLPVGAEMRAQQRVWVEVESDPAAAYPGQQILLKTRLVYNTPISDGRLVEPDTDAAELFSNKRSRRYRIQRDGGEFEVLEKVTALVPEAAGPLRLEAASWQGVMLSRNNPLRRQRTVYRESAQLELDVRNPPTGYSGEYWLPARQLSLSREWQRPAQPLEAGAAIDFTLKITAVGVAAEALPESLLEIDRDEVKIYPDRARRSNEFDGSDLVGRLEQRYVVILPQAGSITIPGRDLTWWNVDSEREMSTRLEAEVIEVAAARTDAPIAYTGRWNDFLLRTDYLFAALLIAIAVGLCRWLPGSGLVSRCRRWLAFRRRLRQAWLGLEHACRGDDAPAARRLLLEWARLRWRDGAICGLHRIEQHLGDPVLGAELRRLDAVLYSAHPLNWHGGRLWQLLRTHRRHGLVRNRNTVRVLPDLYPG